MKVVMLLNEKGGVGKTTLATHIAAGAALKDLRVLLIDGDTQGNSGHQLGLPESDGLYQLLINRAPWSAVLREPEAGHWSGREATVGRLLVLPSDISTRRIPEDIDQNFPMLLHERLQELNSVIDLVVIDTAPTPTLLHSVLMLAAQYVLCPTRCEELSLYGLRQSMIHMEGMNEARKTFNLPPLKLLGVVPMMHEHTLAHNYGVELLENHFHQARVLWQAIPKRTVYVQREFAKKTIFAYAPTDPAAGEMRRLVNRTLKDMYMQEVPSHA